MPRKVFLQDVVLEEESLTYKPLDTKCHGFISLILLDPVVINV